MAFANLESQLKHEYIGTEHILLGLVREGNGVGAAALGRLGVNLCRIRLEVEALVKAGSQTTTRSRLPHTPGAKKSLGFAIDEARRLHHGYIGSEHLLLGLLKEHDGIAAHALRNLGIELDALRKEIVLVLAEKAQSAEEG